MSDFYTSAFVSKDFVEGDPVERAEVFVVVGVGKVKELVESGSGKSKQVVIDAEKFYNNKPMYSKGWAPADSSVIKKAEEALEKGEPVEFRIETVRNKGIDRSEPIEKLKKGMDNARDNIMHSLAQIRMVSEDSWTEGIMRTNPKEDTRKTGRTAADLSDDELDTRKSSSTGNSGYVATLKNGSVDPGSYHVAALSNIYGFVADWNREHDDVEISVEAARKISKSLLSVANKLQVKVYDGELEAPDLGNLSHTRARALIFETIKNQFPLSNEVVNDNAALKAWLKNVYSSALSQWQWSIDEVSALVVSE